jgi:hypothetical protein
MNALQKFIHPKILRMTKKSISVYKTKYFMKIPALYHFLIPKNEKFYETFRQFLFSKAFKEILTKKLNHNTEHLSFFDIFFLESRGV